MKFTAAFMGGRLVARVEGMTIPDVQAKVVRLDGVSKAPFHADLYLGERLMVRVYATRIVWLDRPDAWEQLLEEDGL